MVSARPGLISVCVAVLPLLFGATMAMIFTPSFLALFALPALVRLGWVDDNIANDLVDAEKLPTSYVNTLRRRQLLAWHLFGLRPRQQAEAIHPALLATQFRAEAQALQSAIYGGVAVSGALVMPPVAGFLFFCAVFAAAWRQMDKLAISLIMLERGYPLPRATLLARAEWAVSQAVKKDR